MSQDEDYESPCEFEDFIEEDDYENLIYEAEDQFNTTSA